MKTCRRVPVLFVSFLFAFWSQVSAQAQDVPDQSDESWTESEDSSEISVDLSFSFWSQYLDSTGGYINHSRPVLQSELTISFENGLYLDFWNSTGLNGGGFSSDYGDEFDPTIGWAGDIESLDISLDVGLSYVDLLPVGRASGDDVFWPYIFVSREFEIDENQSFTLTAGAEFLFGSGAGSQGECYPRIGLGHRIGLSDELSLEHGFQIFYDPGIFDLGAGFIGEYGVGLNWTVSGSMTINLGSIRVPVPFSSFSDDRETEFVWGFGISFSF